MTDAATTTLWRILPLLIAAVLVGATWWHGRHRQLLTRLRESWGGSWREPTPPDTARSLLDLLPAPEEGSGYVIDEQTWRDLDMDQVVARLDRTLSPVGAQTLYACLRTPAMRHGESAFRGTLVRTLLADQDLRERVQMAFVHIDEPLAARVCELVWRELPRPPRLAYLAPFMALAATASVVLPWLTGVSWALTLPAFAVNSVIHFVTRRRIDDLPQDCGRGLDPCPELRPGARGRLRRTLRRRPQLHRPKRQPHRGP